MWVRQVQALWFKNVLLLWRQKGLLWCIILFPLLLIGVVGILQASINDLYINPPSHQLKSFSPTPLDSIPSPSPSPSSSSSSADSLPSTSDPFYFEFFYSIDNTSTSSSWLPVGNLTSSGQNSSGLLGAISQWNFSPSSSSLPNPFIFVPYFLPQPSLSTLQTQIDELANSSSSSSLLLPDGVVIFNSLSINTSVDGFVLPLHLPLPLPLPLPSPSSSFSWSLFLSITSPLR
jgi:hypothetical protein